MVACRSGAVRTYWPVMNLIVQNFRHAREILAPGLEWKELEDVARNIGRDDVLAAHKELNEPRSLAGRQPIAGGQSAINELFRRALGGAGWRSEPRLFEATDRTMRGWKMDFIKRGVGVEVSFNHAEAIPWTFTRLNIAGESLEVEAENRIDVGVAFFATDALKKWARMDSAVGTFESAWVWLQLMKPLMPIPILVVGLMPEAEGRPWEPSEAFRGTRKG